MNLNSKDKELIEKASRILVKELGYSGFIKYISRIQTCSDKYFRCKEKVYENIVIDKKISSF
jgi:hypothetical protein